MCGIAGIVGRLSEQQGEKMLQNMLHAEHHRGPDDGGTKLLKLGERIIGLGSRRLAILDLSPLGHQPMLNPETGDTVVYNGELYNSPQLRRTLENEGISFRGRSDTEVLLKSYQRWGSGFLQRLKGMFAFALWDSSRERLLVARDQLGIKPLYYSRVPGLGFLCASEIRALLASGVIPREIDRSGLAGYLAYGAVQDPLTIIKSISSLPAGSLIEVDAAGEIIKTETYWRIPGPDESKRSVSKSDLIAEGRTLLQQAVQDHLLSDVPVGVFLSSGLDSTAVLKFACEADATNISAFTVSTPEHPEIDEGPIARETVQDLGITHHVYPLDDRTALSWAREGMNCQDQPAMDGLNTYIVSRAVKDAGIKVALSGQGGDEIFGGYRSFRGVPLWQRRLDWLRRAPLPVQRAIVKAAKARISSVARGKMDDIVANGNDVESLYFQHRRLLSNGDLQRLGLDSHSLGLTDTFHVPSSHTTNGFHKTDAIALISRLESTFYLGNTLLRDGDVFGMANSLEIRVPMLDKDLIEWAFRLPGSTLLPEGKPTKFLLREMCRDFYSPSQTKQSKLGFSLPIASWLRGPMREVMDQSLTNLSESGLFDPKGITRVKEVFLSEPKTAAWSRVWGLVTLGCWLQSAAGQSL